VINNEVHAPKLSRRERIRQETIAEIKTIARRQMAEQGAVNISLRAIAREMGMTSPALYYYFPNFEALITALIIDAYHASADALEAAQAKQDPEDHAGRLYALLHAYRDWALAFPQDYLLINGTPIPNYNAPREETDGPAHRTFGVFMAILLEAAGAGRLLIPPTPTKSQPALETLQGYWRDVLGATVPVSVMQQALSGWAHLRGLIAMELYGDSPQVMAEVFELEAQASLKRWFGPEVHG
jgi:AcrR family transcriptional regulator